MLRTTGIVLRLLLAATMAAAVVVAGVKVPRIGDPAADVDIKGASWINSPPVTLAGLRGKVVLVEFWTYG